MKRLMILLMMLVMGATVQGQYIDYSTYTFQANTLCPFRITITAIGDVPYYQLKLNSDTLVERGTLAAGEHVDLRLPLTSQWYIVLVESAPDAYTIASDMGCEETSGDQQQAVSDAQLRAIFEEIKPQLQAAMLAFIGPQ